MYFGIKADGSSVKKALNHDLQVALMRNYNDVLPEIADKLIATIRQGNWFTNESGNLKNKLYKSEPKLRQSGASIDVGWSGDTSVYGPVLEFGPKKRQWMIQPKKAKALRFVAGGNVVYAKKVTYNWTEKSKRPHFEPATRRIQGFSEAKLQEAVSAAWKAVGL